LSKLWLQTSFRLSLCGYGKHEGTDSTHRFKKPSCILLHRKPTPPCLLITPPPRPLSLLSLSLAHSFLRGTTRTRRHMQSFALSFALSLALAFCSLVPGAVESIYGSIRVDPSVGFCLCSPCWLAVGLMKSIGNPTSPPFFLLSPCHSGSTGPSASRLGTGPMYKIPFPDPLLSQLDALTQAPSQSYQTSCVLCQLSAQ
jgi:hypothetical protein